MALSVQARSLFLIKTSAGFKILNFHMVIDSRVLDRNA